MNRYNATYYYNSVEYPAVLSLMKDKLIIQIEEQKEVFWYCDQIKKEKAPDTFFYPGYPLQSLVVLSKEQTEAIEAHIERDKKRRSGRKTGLVVKLFAAVLVFLMIAYFFLLPWLASALAYSFPVSYEKQMGEQVYASMKQGFIIDEQRTAYTNEFFRELNFPSDYNVHVTVIKNKVANAFALPGGNIVVHDKILAGIGSYEELAALLSHEFTHIENRHSLRSLFRQLAGRIFISLILGDAGAVSSIIIGNADNLKTLSYSRSLEKEADENGAQLLVQRHIDCSGFVHLFEMLKKESTGMNVSEWMSSHPNLEKRISNIQKNTACGQSKAVKNETLHTLFLKIKTAD